MKNDPLEWNNLSSDPQHATRIAEHRRWLPRVDASSAPGSAHRILSYDPATEIAVWEGEQIDMNDWQK